MSLETMMNLVNTQLEAGGNHTVTFTSFDWEWKNWSAPASAMPEAALYMLEVDPASLAQNEVTNSDYYGRGSKPD